VNSPFAASEELLRGLYTKSSPARHAFTSVPQSAPGYGHQHGDYSLSDQPVAEWVPWIVERYEKQVTLTEALGDDTVPLARLNTATHIFAAAFGCPVHCPKDSNPFALPLVNTPDEADRLEEPTIWDSPCLARVFDLARALEERLGSDVWLGPCDMQTGFDIACLIWRKEELFCAMLDEEHKESVRRLARKCHNLLKTFLLELQREFPQMSLCGCPTVWSPPDLGPWPSNDECGGVSREVFQEYMLPELVDLARAFGSVGMHCCAHADHQFDLFRQIPDFYAFNRVPPPATGPSGFDGALEQLGGPEGPVFVLGWVSEQTVEHVARIAPPGTRFIFQQIVENVDDGKARLEKMREFCS